MYHDVKPEGYQVKTLKLSSSLKVNPNYILQDQEPEYTKVRRKGNRLRDPHSESQGNWNRSSLSVKLTFYLHSQNISNHSIFSSVYVNPSCPLRTHFWSHHDSVFQTKYTQLPINKLTTTASFVHQASTNFIESDNPGSTDSEVRKILTLHIPITEYDTLGSESESEVASRAVNQAAKFRPQRGFCLNIFFIL